MNLYQYFLNKISSSISNFSGDMHELAIIRNTFIESAKIFHRDYTFFLDKENLTDRANVYNLAINPENVDDSAVVCKKYCIMLCEVLRKNFDLNVDEVTAAKSQEKDIYGHYDILLKAKSGNNYILDPLGDLAQYQMGMKSMFFASKSKFDTNYLNKIGSISFIEESDLEKIDRAIGYITDNYYDYEISLLADRLQKIEDKISARLLIENNNPKLVEKMQNFILEKKLDEISKFWCNHKNLNGLAEFNLYVTDMLDKIFSKDTRQKIGTTRFFVDKEDVCSEELTSFLGEEKRKRGITVQVNNKIYVYSLKSNSYLKYNKNAWNDIVKQNNIIIKKYYRVESLKYLKENGANGNLILHNEFLKNMNKIEQRLKSAGISNENMQKYIKINNGNVIVNYGSIIEFAIKDKFLTITNHKDNISYIVEHLDEGKIINYIETKRENPEVLLNNH